jgi:general secretion pathway protein F/type IV pilus assembly protein PilC
MPEFVYTARTLSGENVVGTMTAASKRDTLSALAEQSLFALRVESKERAWGGWKLSRPIKAQLLATTLSQLADLLRNGVPMLGALEILAEQAPDQRLGTVLADVRDRVSEGASLEEAFAAHPTIFSELTISMVRAGSEGAFLEDALKHNADFLELQHELKVRLIGAMMYPAFLAILGFLVTTALLVFLVPRFASLFELLERQVGGLPTPTVILLWVSDVLGRYGLLILAAVVGIAMAGRSALSSPKTKLRLDRWKLKIPLAGKVFHGYAVSRFCRILGTLLRNGVPILRALEISSDSAGNAVLSQAIRESAENISSGETLAKPLAECGLIPRPVMAMISIAEESNSLDNVLIEIADGIDRQNSRQLDVMVRLVEPIMLLVMGLVIGFVIVALLLPVFEMSQAMS